VTAVAGGIGLVSGAIAPGVELLKGSPFSDYTIPGICLALLVGGGATTAAVLMIRRHPLASYACALSGGMIVFFEMVEVLVIGSDPGVARTLQLFYFIFGLVLFLLSTWLWAANRPKIPGA
jgi:hypothetical protein